jgi:hypothetical protein
MLTTSKSISAPTVPSGNERRRLQLGAVLDVLRLDDVLHHLLRQVGGEVGDLVGVEVLGRGDDLRVLHVREQRVAHRVGDLEQDLAAVFANLLPGEEAVVERQVLEHIGDVGGVHPPEAPAKLVEAGALAQLLDRPVAAQHRFHRLQVLLRGGGAFGAARRRGAHGSSAEGMRSRIICVFFARKGVARLRS